MIDPLEKAGFHLVTSIFPVIGLSMDTMGMKIKGAITSFLSLAVSIDGIVFFSFFAIWKAKGLLPFLLAAIYFLFEAVGRIYALSYTMANRKVSKEASEAKARLALALGVWETICIVPWIAAAFCCGGLSYKDIGPIPLIFLFFKISAELVLSFFRYFPHSKKRITLASESLCSLCVALSLFLAILVFYLGNDGYMDRVLAVNVAGIIFLVLFFAQNGFFSILLFQGRVISRIKQMVVFGTKYSIGNYFVVSSSAMTFIVSTITAIKEKNPAYAGIAIIYLSLGLIRLSALLWKNAIHRHVYNKRLAEAEENKILLYVGALLAGLSVLFAYGLFWMSRQEMQQSGAFVLGLQIIHGLFRLFLCIKNYIASQKKNKPFSIAVSSLDMLVGVYSLFSIFLLINLYCKFAWMEQAITIMSWLTMAGSLALGVIMILLGIQARPATRRLAKEIKDNSAEFKASSQAPGPIESLSEEEVKAMLANPDFANALHKIDCIGPSSIEEESWLKKQKELQNKSCNPQDS